MSLLHTYCRGTFFTLFDKDIEPNYFWKIWASEASWVCFCCFCIDIPRQSPSPPPPPPSCWCPCALQAMSCTPPPILSPPSCWRPGASWTTRRCSPRSRCSTSRCTLASTPLEGERRIDEELSWSNILGLDENSSSEGWGNFKAPPTRQWNSLNALKYKRKHMQIILEIGGAIKASLLADRKTCTSLIDFFQRVKLNRHHFFLQIINIDTMTLKMKVCNDY